MEKLLCAIILSLLPFTGVQAAINPFKPYMPLNRIDYSHNISLTKDATSIAYRPESFAQTSLLPAGLLATSFLFDDYKLDKSILIKAGLDIDQAKKSAIRLAIITAPYVYLIPSEWFYN